MKRYIIIFILIFLITFIYSYFFSFLNLDEIWNYGFSYNIASGLVPYKDFNLLQMPLLFFIGSLFIRVFGHHLWSVHIFNSIIISIMFISMYKHIGKKTFILYPIILIYSTYSYNIFCLFLAVLLINLLDNDDIISDYLIAFLVSCIFLSKQSIGICLFIPMIYYSKNKIKSFIIFLIPNILLIIYLIINNCLFSFINYSFLGMFDFGKSNGIYYFIIFYLVLLIYLVYKLLKSKFINKYLFYILMFQIVGFPIIDDYHFMIGFILFLYYILLKKHIEFFKFKYYFIISLSFFMIYIINEDIKLDDYSIFKNNLYNNKDSFLYGRKFSRKSSILLNNISDVFLDNYNNYDNVYLFFNWAYLVKLNINKNPNKYDLILNGNMGYKGENRIINSLKEKCSKESCFFIVQKGGNQVNIDIIKYVVFSYKENGHIDDLIHDKKNKIDTNYIIYTND